ncbi:transmembrane secretion effector [Isoptericola jiangsuensis]|uniref:Transmembrane secretion effector n=1 Tax=Isoptericola jiangsuensis TaxID=548579 RepID=A0A2A9ES31_9MICO|nr:MFS transporter [Isoptericola jiangsuensis]PFG41563.1 transmembrane secretion effector [Isoptericola jiangsuensis]
MTVSDAPAPTGPTAADRRARAAVSALFLTNGALFANLLPRYPEIKAALDLSNTVYGLMVVAFPAGAMLSGLAAAAIIRRFGSAAVAVGGTVLTALAMVGVGFSPSLALVAVALFAGGAADAVTDVGQNAHGLRVQRRYGRSIFNSFHALWSAGAVLGGGMAAAAIALDLPLGVHLTISGTIFCLVALTAYRFRLPGHDADVRAADDAAATARTGDAGHDPAGDHGTAGPAPRGARVGLLLAAFVVVATAGAIIEDGANAWATLYLSGSLGAVGAVAATGFVAFMAMEFLGRATGDRFVDRFGQAAVARAGGLLVAVAMGLALALPSVPTTIAGFALAGFGVATVIPAAMHAADELPGLRAGTGLAVVSWLLRLGFLLMPPVIGILADATSLRAALLVVPVAGLTVVVAGAMLPGRRRAGTIDA